MSKLAEVSPRRVTVQTFQQRKQAGQKIASLTCYDYTTARLLDETDLDFLLVGDSLAMTVLGHPNTLSVTVDEMLHHVRAVKRGVRRAMIVADMPFMSYQVDLPSAVRNAGRFVQEGGADAVKIEAATPLTLEIVRHLTRIGIPVMGHLGFTPQSVQTLSGFKVQGKTLDQARQLRVDAQALADAGAFAVVLEMVPVEVAEVITRELPVPTIGIGAGAGCDGQILVIDDLLGRFQDLSPRFVRRYLDAGALIRDAVDRYAADIAAGAFPDNRAEAFALPDAVRDVWLAETRMDSVSENRAVCG